MFNKGQAVIAIDGNLLSQMRGTRQPAKVVRAWRQGRYTYYELEATDGSRAVFDESHVAAA